MHFGTIIRYLLLYCNATSPNENDVTGTHHNVLPTDRPTNWHGTAANPVVSGAPRPTPPHHDSRNASVRVTARTPVHLGGVRSGRARHGTAHPSIHRSFVRFLRSWRSTPQVVGAYYSTVLIPVQESMQESRNAYMAIGFPDSWEARVWWQHLGTTALELVPSPNSSLPPSST